MKSITICSAITSTSIAWIASVFAFTQPGAPGTLLVMNTAIITLAVIWVCTAFLLFVLS